MKLSETIRRFLVFESGTGVELLHPRVVIITTGVDLQLVLSYCMAVPVEDEVGGRLYMYVQSIWSLPCFTYFSRLSVPVQQRS